LTNRTRPVPSDPQEVTTRHRIARDLTTRLAAEHPADIWQHLLSAFADIPGLTAELTRLRAGLAHARLDLANLAAAALASIAAHDEGDSDPLCYLRDELRAQGHDTTGWGTR
jgi:hypothetical protein